MLQCPTEPTSVQFRRRARGAFGRSNTRPSPWFSHSGEGTGQLGNWHTKLPKGLPAGYDDPMKQNKPKRSALTYAQALDAFDDFWAGKLDAGRYAEIRAVLDGEMLAADDLVDFKIQGPTSLEIFNRGY